MSPIENPLLSCIGHLGHPLPPNKCKKCPQEILELCKNTLINNLKHSFIITGRSIIFSCREEQLEITDHLKKQIEKVWSNFKRKQKTDYVSVGKTCVNLRIPVTQVVRFRLLLEDLIKDHIEHRYTRILARRKVANKREIEEMPPKKPPLGWPEICDICGQREPKVKCKYCGKYLCLPCYGTCSTPRKCCAKEETQ